MKPHLKESETPQPVIWIATTANRVERRRFQGVVARLFPGITYGPRHAKMWSWAYANSEDPDEPVHPHSLTRAFAVH